MSSFWSEVKSLPWAAIWGAVGPLVGAISGAWWAAWREDEQFRLRTQATRADKRYDEARRAIVNFLGTCHEAGDTSIATKQLLMDEAGTDPSETDQKEAVARLDRVNVELLKAYNEARLVFPKEFAPLITSTYDQVLLASSVNMLLKYDKEELQSRVLKWWDLHNQLSTKAHEYLESLWRAES